MDHGPSRALVLGGGGVAGIAWEIGVLRGLEEAGVDVHAWQLVVGTSAGALVGARILSDPDLGHWYRHETRDVTAAEDALIGLLAGRMGGTAMRLSRRRALAWLGPTWVTWLSLEAMVRHRARRGVPRGAPPRGAPLPPGLRRITGPNPALVRLGQIAHAARTAPERAFLQVIADVLECAGDWPANLVVTAVDTADGSTLGFGAGSGVPLPTAVAASAAVPVLFPTVTALGRHWMDGGMASTTHATVAGDADEILVIAPLRVRGLDEEVRVLRARGRRVIVITPGTAGARILGLGVGLLDPIRRPTAAEAGRLDALEAARRLRQPEPDAATTAPAA
ncbi:MAG TPA: patatin-like phospholipase family protein [Candidatus Limnocylindrales bacterium]|nr:patatin-like phospholipase family protein [Candidatus Limnocylindrales bacterium]